MFYLQCSYYHEKQNKRNILRKLNVKDNYYPSTISCLIQKTHPNASTNWFHIRVYRCRNLSHKWNQSNSSRWQKPTRLPIFTRTKKHLLIQYLLALGSFHLYGFCDSSSLQVSSSFQGDPPMEGTKTCRIGVKNVSGKYKVDEASIQNSNNFAFWEDN